MAITFHFDPPNDDHPTTVDVFFVDKDEVVHQRHVNACFDEDGKFDEAATEIRVGEVARGVTHKIKARVVSKPGPLPYFEPPSDGKMSKKDRAKQLDEAKTAHQEKEEARQARFAEAIVKAPERAAKIAKDQ